MLKGPVGTPYEDGSFKIMITIPDNYPFTVNKFNLITNLDLNIDLGTRF